MQPITQIVDIIEGIVANLSHTYTIASIVIDGDGNQVLNTDNTYYCTIANTVTIDALDYSVKSFVFNQSITVTPIGHATLVTASSFELPAPTFYYGTVRSTDVEIKRDTAKLYPIAYLASRIREEVLSDPAEAIDHISNIQIFFLDIANYSDNLNKDFLNDVQRPLSNVEAKFRAEIENHQNIGQIRTNGSRENIERFAREDQNGELDLIFSEELSGMGIEMALPISNC